MSPLIGENEAPKVSKKIRSLPNEERKTMPQLVKLPSISIIGCGGCGTNLINKFASITDHDKLNFKIFDTSKSNYLPNEKIEFVDISLGSIGSGKFRAENYDVIDDFMKKYIKDTKNRINDINVIVFSLSGGSGSIIGPIMVKELLKIGKGIVLITVGNDISEIDIINTLNSIKTIINISKNHYIPILPLSNEVGRETVDNYVMEFLDIFAKIVLSSGREIDYTDKMNFLDPRKILPKEILPGVHVMLNIRDAEKVEDLNDFRSKNGIVVDDINTVESMFLIHKEDELKSKISTKLIYQGFDSNIDGSSLVSMILPNGIKQGYIDRLQKQLDEFQKIKSSNEIFITEDIGDTMENGVVL